MKKLPSVSFFCPAYCDEENLPKLIPKADALLKKIAKRYEIIIIEDCSPDKTGDVADSLAKEYNNIQVIHHKTNRGYGGALKSGFENSKYEYVMYTDGDNQYDVDEFYGFIPFLDYADVVSGYARKKAVTFRRKVQSLIYNKLISILFFIPANDLNCSMKIYKRKVIDSMKIHSLSAFIDAEMIIKARRKGFKIKQLPVTHYSRLSGVEGGSKMNVIVDTIKDMIRFRLGYF